MHFTFVFTIFLVLMSSLLTSSCIIEPKPICELSSCCEGQYPVCAHDGNTYGSYCSMKLAGQEMKYDGKCKEPNNGCGSD